MVYRLRQALSAGKGRGTDYILSKQHRYVWNSQAPCFLDVASFESLCQQAQEAAGEDEQISLYQQAFSLYQGDFLPQKFQPSCVVAAASHNKRLYLRVIGRLAQLSAATGIPPSSTHRILQEMQHCGFVIKDEVKKCYRAGFEARLLAIQLQKTNFLYEAARGEMAYLNDLSLETIHLIGEEDMEAIYLAKLGAKSSVGLHSAVGKRTPLHCTGGGKAILAWRSESWLENYLAHVKWERFTGKTLTDADSQYIWDGYFHESELASAPSFDFIIDGISIN